MKKLRIELLPDVVEAAGHYLPGDSVAGNVHLTTTANLKYTCVRIHLIGLVTTKVAKAEEQVYVMNHQVVLIGSATNAIEYMLEEGKHSWPFQFSLPLQHIPSSGKYRHGTVKYFLAATLTSTGLMGGMQELKETLTIPIKDLINVSVAPYSAPVSVKGSSSLNSGGHNPRDLATAVVKLSRSAYLKGQHVQIEIDLYHPSKIQRNPGCFIQLIRKESYFAGEHAKEYSDKMVVRAEPLFVSADLNTGKIMTELTIPDTAVSSLSTTKILCIEYQLVVLLDMRKKTGFLEPRHGKKVKAAMRNRLLSNPGGFEVIVPIVIGTTSDGPHPQESESLIQSRAVQQGPPQSPTSDSSSGSLALSGSPAGSPGRPLNPPSSPTAATTRLHLPASALPSSPPGYTTRHFRSEGHTGYNTLPSSTVPPNGYGLLPPQAPGLATVSTCRSRSYTAIPLFPSAPSTPITSRQNDPSLISLISKPLPSLPQSSNQSAPSPTHHTSPTYYTSSTNITSPTYSTSPTSPSPPLAGYSSWGYEPSGSESGSGSAGQRSAYHSTSVPVPRLPLRPPPQTSFTGQEHSYIVNQSGYPLEKEIANPQPMNIPPPISLAIEVPTAPCAVDLGLSPASPNIEHSQTVHRPRRLSEPSASAHIVTNDPRHYLALMPNPPDMMSLNSTMSAPPMPSAYPGSMVEDHNWSGHYEDPHRAPAYYANGSPSYSRGP
ncbi:Arrestin domain-containing protein 3 [Mortierella claussenii]|nr:Arrestin domain-containing protein 3 [Mortierella claussenii]